MADCTVAVQVHDYKPYRAVVDTALVYEANCTCGWSGYAHLEERHAIAETAVHIKEAERDHH